jgi:hypothetical protein
LTVFLALMTADTVPLETPARFATSSIVIRFVIVGVARFDCPVESFRFDSVSPSKLTFFGAIEKGLIVDGISQDFEYPALIATWLPGMP